MSDAKKKKLVYDNAKLVKKMLIFILRAYVDGGSMLLRKNNYYNWREF